MAEEGTGAGPSQPAGPGLPGTPAPGLPPGQPRQWLVRETWFVELAFLVPAVLAAVDNFARHLGGVGNISQFPTIIPGHHVENLILGAASYLAVGAVVPLALLILAMALHFVLIGLGLVFFGPEEASAPSLTDASFEIGLLNVSGQSLIVLGCCATLVLGLRWFFGATMHGKVLRAAASDRLGARLVVIDASATGALAFGLASFIAALAGVLIGAVTPLSYDAGFDIGLKGFVAAIMGGLVSYPMAAAGAVLVGVLESLGSFWASAYREVIVFTVLIPVLVFLSLRSGSAEDRA